MKKLLFVLLSFISTLSYAQSYSYKLYLLPPFNAVKINDAQVCPEREDHKYPCEFVQETNTTVKLTGIKEHVCYYQVQASGSLIKDEARSYFCDGGFTIAASTVKAGEIHLPKHF